MLIEIYKTGTLVDTYIQKNLIGEVYNNFSTYDLTDFVALREETRALRDEALASRESNKAALTQMAVGIVDTQKLVVINNTGGH